MIINMSSGLQQTFAQQMRKQLNPVMPNPIKQIVENRIENQKESGRFDTVKFSKMLNMPVEDVEEGLNFEERLKLKEALGLMASSVREALNYAKSAPEKMELAKEGEAYYKDILSRFDDDKDYLMVDEGELAFGLKDESDTSPKTSDSHIIDVSSPKPADSGKSLVRRSTVQKALENVRKTISGLTENGANSPHKFTEDGYVYSDLRPMSSNGFKVGATLFEEVLPDLVGKFESFFKKGSELCEESGYGDDFDAGSESRISALEEFLADLEFVEEDFTPRYRLPEEEEDVKVPDESEMEKNAQLLELMLKKYDKMYS